MTSPSASSRAAPSVSARQSANPESSGTRSLRRLVLTAWGGVAVLGVLGFLTLDLDWEARANAAYRRGERLLLNDPFAALPVFEQVLRDNPGHAPARLELAALHERFTVDNARARYHYEAYLALPNIPPDKRDDVTARLSLLKALDEGVVEDPVDAARDLLAAARDETFEAFRERAGPYLDKLAKQRRTRPLALAQDTVWPSWHRAGGIAPQPLVLQRTILVPPPTADGRALPWTAQVRLNWAQPPEAGQQGRLFSLSRADNGLWKMTNVH